MYKYNAQRNRYIFYNLFSTIDNTFSGYTRLMIEYPSGTLWSRAFLGYPFHYHLWASDIVIFFSKDIMKLKRIPIYFRCTNI